MVYHVCWPDHVICMCFTLPGVVQGPVVPGHEHCRSVHSLPVRLDSETVLPGDQTLYRGTGQAGEREPQTGRKLQLLTL